MDKDFPLSAKDTAKDNASRKRLKTQFDFVSKRLLTERKRLSSGFVGIGWY
ncbi:MAG: hypothetical protein RR338_01140 [Clostridia bacterium]